MIYYRLYQNQSTKVGTAGKWYARAAYTDTVELDELAEHMANHNTPYSKGAIKGVLTDMVNCIKEIILEGKKVKIPDLAIFSAGITSSGADTRKTFFVQKNIKNVKLKCRGTGCLLSRDLATEASIKEWTEYTPE